MLAILLPLASQQLEAVAVLGIPLGYYVGAQGALVGFAILALVHVRRQRTLDQLASRSSPATSTNDIA